MGQRDPGCLPVSASRRLQQQTMSLAPLRKPPPRQPPPRPPISQLSTEPGSDTTGQGLNLTVGQLPETLAPLSGSFTKYINVWGINVVGTPNTNDTKIIHAANVMAQYLDNDADGNPDNPAVIEAMVANNATLVMGATPEELEALPDLEQMIRFVGEGGQGLYGSETAPAYGFDASLEEIHHLILNTGWAQIFGDQLAQTKGSAIAGAMDLARGGRFDTIPSPYPDGAWFTYDDRTCDYSCMVTEYTLLGAHQPSRRPTGPLTRNRARMAARNPSQDG